MKIIDTALPGVKIIEPRVFGDERGYFFESYNEERWKAVLGNVRFVQDNESRSVYGVLRGLHYQLPPFAQSKLVRVIAGRVLDVAVDLRQDSPHFGQHVAVELSGENKKQLWIPAGFAHGFVVLSDEAIFSYKVDQYYSKEHERGVLFNDPALGIDWQLPAADIILSDKDQILPLFAGAEPF